MGFSSQVTLNDLMLLDRSAAITSDFSRGDDPVFSNLGRQPVSLRLQFGEVPHGQSPRCPQDVYVQVWKGAYALPGQVGAGSFSVQISILVAYSISYCCPLVSALRR
jgi:hypothetical protein